MVTLLLEFFLIGLTGGLLGIFYRDCLKPEDMIFRRLYRQFDRLYSISTKKGATTFDKFMGWIVYPLGYCIYCSTTWITFILCTIYLSSWEVLPKWQNIVIGIVLASGVQHLVVASACRFLISGHPDLDTEDCELKKTKQK